MNETALITVTYGMVMINDVTEAKISLTVDKQLAQILVLDRHCAENTVAKAAVTQIVCGLARLQGYAFGTTRGIRYAEVQT